MSRIPHVVSVEHLDGYRVLLRFDDGVMGEVDLSEHLWGPMFDPLRDPEVFARVSVDPELGTIAWPNGADIDPCSLHDAVVASAPTRASS